MSITLNPSITATPSFKSNATQAGVALPAPKAIMIDDVSKPEKTEKKKTGIIQGWKNFSAGWQKFWLNAGQYTKATVVGAFQGAIYGGITLGAIKIAKAFKKIPDAVLAKGNEGINAFRKLGKGHKIAAGIVAVATLLLKYYNTSLYINKREADIDHEYKTGHDVK